MELSKEQQILRMIRKTLGAIAQETAPQGNEEHPLTEQTFQDMRNCFGMITEWEKELAAAAGMENNLRPGFSDEQSSAQVISIDELKRS